MPVSSNGHAWWVLKLNQQFPLSMSPVGHSLCFLSLKCSLGSGASVKHTLFMAILFVWRDAFATRFIFTGSRNYATQAAILDWLIIHTDIARCGHGNGAQTVASRTMVPTPGSRTYTITFRLLLPHLEAFSGNMQSVTKLCVVICGSTFALLDIHTMLLQHHHQMQSDWC